MFNILTNKRLS